MHDTEMYDEHTATSTSPISRSNGTSENHDSSTDFSAFNLVSIAAEASNVEDDVALGSDLDKIHASIDEFDPQFDRTNDGTLSSTEIDTTTKALMEMAQSSLKAKKSCQFCGMTFSHPGSLGRHLDMKKGTRLHPAEEIELLRANVKRRGDIVEIKNRRSQRAKLYNSREDVKQRAKVRRKLKERMDKAQAMAKEGFIERIGMPSLPAHPSFAYVVLYFLPPSQWPHDPPTTQTFQQLEHALQPLQSLDTKMFNEYVNKVNVAFEQWSVMNKQTKSDIWAREQRRVAEAALGSLSLYELGSRNIWLKVEQEKVLEQLNQDVKPEEETTPQPDDEDKPVKASGSLDQAGSSDREHSNESVLDPAITKQSNDLAEMIRPQDINSRAFH